MSHCVSSSGPDRTPAKVTTFRLGGAYADGLKSNLSALSNFRIQPSPRLPAVEFSVAHDFAPCTLLILATKVRK
jgi:hypothetical protein